MTPIPTSADLIRTVIPHWYAAHARDLPWRAADRCAWGVLVSEFMLQQTPVDRVLPMWLAWMSRWPIPRALAGEPAGEAVRAWGRLGYPRRALRLHAAATAITEVHGGIVPADQESLRALPGVGEYTAAAVAAFAYDQRVAVLDTNVRRVHARVLGGSVSPGPSPTVGERARALELLPMDPTAAALLSVAVMEFGALVCTAVAPSCPVCPLRGGCAWFAAGRPGLGTSLRRAQPYAGTDRQVRGKLLAVLRDAAGSVPRSALERVWADSVQRERALDSLVADGLVEPLPRDRFALPGSRTSLTAAP